MRIYQTADMLMARILFVRTQVPESDVVPSTQLADRAFGGSLLFSALRCTVQYLILPFVLPIVGVAARPSLGVMIVLDVVALVALVTSLRRFWQVRHPRRWDYLPLALAMALVIVAFLAYDFYKISG